MFDGKDGSSPPMSAQAARLMHDGTQYHLAGNVDAARMYYDAVLLLEPDNPVALQNLSGVLFSSMQSHSALSVAARAIRAAPKNPYALSNHAAALMHLGRFALAQREVEEVLQSVSDDGGILHNYALILYMQGRIGKALEVLERALALRQTQDMLADRGIFTLASGDIARGCELYECRWNTLYRSPVWEAGLPEWKGEDLGGKRILLAHEQGMGDGIMLARLVPDLQARGATVTLAVPSELVRLMEHSTLGVPVIDFRVPLERAAARWDYHTPMLSALGHLGHTSKTISSALYLRAEPREGSLGPEGFRVGICWASGDHSPMMRHRRRVIPLELFFCFAEIPGVRLVSLQKGPGQDDIIKAGAESFIFDPMGTVVDFYDTARIISRLDLVVSVDSAVAHLAGAMGKPVMMLGPYTRCWRWWGETTGAPWYSDFRIFAAEGLNEWAPAVKRARLALEHRAALLRKAA